MVWPQPKRAPDGKVAGISRFSTPVGSLIWLFHGIFSCPNPSSRPSHIALLLFFIDMDAVFRDRGNKHRAPPQLYLPVQIRNIRAADKRDSEGAQPPLGGLSLRRGARHGFRYVAILKTARIFQ